eukprot:g1610.t1
MCCYVAMSRQDRQDRKIPGDEAAEEGEMMSVASTRASAALVERFLIVNVERVWSEYSVQTCHDSRRPFVLALCLHAFCVEAAESQPSGDLLDERFGYFGAFCIVDLLNAMNDETCSIVNEIARTDRGSYAGQTTSFDAFLVLADCGYMSYLIWGAIGGTLSGMGPGALAILGIVLMCWPIGACKVPLRSSLMILLWALVCDNAQVLCRCCRRCCCRCCREAPEVRSIGKVKKTLILLLSVAGVGGMAVLPLAGVMGNLKEGPSLYQDADCAARLFLKSALGDTAAIGSSGSAASQDGGATASIQESAALLRLIQDSLGNQITVDGFTQRPQQNTDENQFGLTT